MRLLLLGPTDDYLRKVMMVAPSVVVLTETKRLTPWQRTAPCEIHLADFDDIPGLLFKASAINTRTPLRAVLSFTELGTVPAAIIGRTLSIAAPPLHASLVSRDKLLTREALRAQGLTKVAFFERRTCTSDHALHNEGPGTLIAKPVGGTGSCDVHRVEAGATVPLAANGRYIVESWVPGEEFSCETFSIAGVHHLLAVTEKRLGGVGGLVEVGHVVDSESSALSTSQWHYIRRCLDAIGLTDGPGHLEFKVDGDAIEIIECHNRPGGDRIWNLVEIVTGFDMITAHARLLLGGPVEVLLTRHGCAAISYFDFPVGTVRSIHVPERSAGYVHWFEMYLRPGDTIKAMTDSFHRHGGIIVSAPDRLLLEERLNLELDRIEVIVDP
ncbi:MULTISPECIES: ATP-grasp domain-containing protein [unclassified Pseudomonas]|uniref:ATP-grasp domain-containing protein n=1 Tax=unclassified Pseudomonas TaxID=196821 RepID=UPI000BCB5E01|nr:MULTISPECIES: ATP-grasp domain-containing protein [unclassified Pseudomonas]PVZ11393.1 ATP-grasp domain-containing protein [Pseudomonas sp. URIL14HWK12:I12]PVZ22391.1 ATP-grasp domain-containing protein [Pseudomonas sp. URIL14HWK12:I10]PVZ31485.1 ATP-grasp domain-containing protein [Pseudomonas sp. URIL14HWK12:I11]SNZ16437.1 Biotin carboxylase [Pseudomonas sp. URIL14HWK12:I9]